MLDPVPDPAGSKAFGSSLDPDPAGSNISGSGALLHGTLVVGVSQTTAFNRGHHLYSAGRPSRWALAHISSFDFVFSVLVKRLARKSISKMTYFVLSGM